MKQRILEYKNFRMSETDVATLVEMLTAERQQLYKVQFTLKGSANAECQAKIRALTTRLDAATQWLDLGRVA